MEHCPWSSTAIAGALLLAATICFGGASTGNAQVPGDPVFPPVECSDGNGGQPAVAPGEAPNWAYYVEQVLTALETTAPNSQAFYAQFWYPEYATGNPRGAAACSTTLEVADCEACLAGVKKNLEACKSYAKGRSENADCSMTFFPIGA
ncbi:unnamed protein product [Linum trigynum]|uniref:Gnk2-homologous domain-containing protein n=1 Tax=Linum trigynum TaxID=586398 RepID=A0AAV2FU32_9ROSI